jgi:ribosomal protein S18 acetylase RimI-like enzyme
MPTRDGAGGPIVRRAKDGESDAVADLMWAVREQSLAVGSIPKGVHPLDDLRRWMREVVFARHDVWVAERGGGEIVGLMVLDQPDWLGHLYIDASATGRGLGSRLVDLARTELAGDQIQLWTFQSNVGARRFYERHGFVAVQTTDGDNEEQAPDVRYVWRRDAARSSAVGRGGQ